MVKHHQLTVPPNYHCLSRPSSFPIPTRRRAHLHWYYTPPSIGTPASADVNQIDLGVTLVNDAVNAKKKSISGKAAAGILIPPLFISLCVVAWFKMQGAMGKEKRRGRSDAVDKRMSLLSELGKLDPFVRVDDVGSAGRVEVADYGW